MMVSTRSGTPDMGAERRVHQLSAGPFPISGTGGGGVLYQNAATAIRTSARCASLARRLSVPGHVACCGVLPGTYGRRSQRATLRSRLTFSVARASVRLSVRQHARLQIPLETGAVNLSTPGGRMRAESRRDGRRRQRCYRRPRRRSRCAGWTAARSAPAFSERWTSLFLSVRATGRGDFANRSRTPRPTFAR